jgi:nucleotide-binding universal stress UspA family protein
MAIQKAKAMAEQFGSEIVLIHVIETTVQDYPSNPYKFSRDLIEKLREEKYDRSEKILAQAKTNIVSLGDKVTTYSIEGLPYVEIVDYAKKAGVDLIIIGSSGTSGIRNMLGSIARKVAINAEMSVLIVK